jgi:P27 family predicted phage terminase small subunit
MPKHHKPKPPEDLDAEALLEWGRICRELKGLGRLELADRAIMTTHCQIWSVFRKNAKAVSQFGAVVRWHNGVAGPAPFYRVARETAALLRGTLADLGLTPASRGLKVQAEEPGELEI